MEVDQDNVHEQLPEQPLQRLPEVEGEEVAVAVVVEEEAVVVVVVLEEQRARVDLQANAVFYDVEEMVRNHRCHCHVPQSQEELWRDEQVQVAEVWREELLRDGQVPVVVVG